MSVVGRFHLIESGSRFDHHRSFNQGRPDPPRQTPPKRGLCIEDSPACGGPFNVSNSHGDSGVNTIRNGQGAAQCTASLFAAAAIFFGSVSRSTPSLYLACAVASSTSWPSVNARWSLP